MPFLSSHDLTSSIITLAASLVSTAASPSGTEGSAIVSNGTALEGSTDSTFTSSTGGSTAADCREALPVTSESPLTQPFILLVSPFDSFSSSFNGFSSFSCFSMKISVSIGLPSIFSTHGDDVKLGEKGGSSAVNSCSETSCLLTST